jgi:hypothetical protein
MTGGMHILRTLGLAAPLAALLFACAGRVEVVGSKGSGGNGGDDGGGDESIALPPCPDARDVGSNATCSYQGQQCPSANLSGCDGGPGNIPVECTCMQGIWQCVSTQPSCIAPSPPGCPAEQSVAQGGYCYNAPDQTCTGEWTESCPSGPVTSQTYCSCQSNAWVCNPVATLCPEGPDGGGCPSPWNVFSGASCVGNAVNCAGNPQPCGTSTVFDAFDCINGAWVDVAPTTCDLDGGPPADTGPPDTGPLPDAGWFD